MSAVLKKSTPGKFAYTCHFQQIGINATKIEKTGIHFKTDVFAAVAVVDAKAPYFIRMTCTFLLHRQIYAEIRAANSNLDYYSFDKRHNRLCTEIQMSSSAFVQ